MSTENKKLSYRKQIARQLRTQYVDGIYNNTVTLKSRGRSTSLKLLPFESLGTFPIRIP